MFSTQLISLRCLTRACTSLLTRSRSGESLQTQFHSSKTYVVQQLCPLCIHIWVHCIESTVRSSSGLTFRAVLLPAAAVLQRSYCKYQKSQGAGTGEAGSTLWPGRAVKGAAQSLCHMQTLSSMGRIGFVTTL